MDKTHHDMPTLLVTDGYKTQEYSLTLTESAHPELVISSRVGFGGELVHRSYTITPALPEKIRQNPKQFLQELIDLFKFQNFDKEQNLWVTRATYYTADKTESVDAHLTTMEYYLYEFRNPKRLHMDITPREDQ